MREGDAEPDQIAIVPEETLSAGHSTRPSTPGGRPIPTMVVEKIDPETPSHGEVPGTDAHEMRKADAVPDMVIRAASHSPSRASRLRSASTPGDLPIPSTKVELVDDKPGYGDVPGTEAYKKREEDAVPDEVQVVGDLQGKPLSSYVSPASD